MKRHALTIAALLGLSSCVQFWSVTHAVIPAQDAVRFTKIAEAIEREGLASVLRDHPEHPLFPASVWLTHRARGLWRSGTPDAWAASAQLAAAAMLVLAVMPVYGLLLCLTRWPAAVAGGCFFCVMTPVARLGADGLSDSTHLCLLCVALWATAKWFGGRNPGQVSFDVGRWAFDVGSARKDEHRTSNIERPTSNGAAFQAERRSFVGPSHWLFFAGLFLALASLARKEALVLAPAIGLAIIAVQCTAWRRRWRGLLRGGMGLGLGMAIVLAPYLAASDALSPRQAMARLLGDPLHAELSGSALTSTDEVNVPQAQPKKTSRRWRTSDGQPMVFDKKDSRASIRFHGHFAAVKAFVCELPEACNYWVGGLMVVGLCVARGRVPQPMGILLLAFVSIYSAAAIHFAAGLGYLAPRHLLPLVVIGLGFAGEGAIGSWNAEFGMRNWLGHRRLSDFHQFRIPNFAFRICQWLLVAVAALACLPRTLAPLHASRLGHRQAAQWLAAQPGSEEAVLDTRGFTRLLSGRKTYAFEQARQALRDPRLAYVVVERRELEYDSPRGRTLRELLARHARRIACFAADQPGIETVEVYEWGPPVVNRHLSVAAAVP